MPSGWVQHSWKHSAHESSAVAASRMQSICMNIEHDISAHKSLVHGVLIARSAHPSVFCISDGSPLWMLRQVRTAETVQGLGVTTAEASSEQGAQGGQGVQGVHDCTGRLRPCAAAHVISLALGLQEVVHRLHRCSLHVSRTGKDQADDRAFDCTAC